jgi:catechol 2,3-dioxygenase-like lactoylglutathione lyase family enzyme
MPVQLTKDAIDLGIVVNDIEASLAFYRDTLGLPLAGEMPMPGGSHMWRLQCGGSTIKLVKHAREPKAVAPPGGINGATGYRYWTMSVSNLEEMTAACGAAGYNVVIPVTEIRPGVSISMIEDPDGNWVELLSAS